MRYQDRNEFRKSRIWQDFRNSKAEEQGFRDFITGKELEENWNLHHCDLNHDRYFDLSCRENFVCLNKEQHTLIHKFFLEDWETMNLDEKTRQVLTRMKELNKDNIEPLLFSCHVEYGFAHKNKFVTQTLAKRLNISCDRYGMILWNPNTPGADSMQPFESVGWAVYMARKNNFSMTQLITCMELRHLCLYSSLKNRIRPDVKAKWTPSRYIETKMKLENELKNTTIWLFKWKK